MNGRHKFRSSRSRGACLACEAVVRRGTSRCTPNFCQRSRCRACASSSSRARHNGESALSLALLTTASQARHAPRLAPPADFRRPPDQSLGARFLFLGSPAPSFFCNFLGDFHLYRVTRARSARIFAHPHRENRFSRRALFKINLQSSNRDRRFRMKWLRNRTYENNYQSLI